MANLYLDPFVISSPGPNCTQKEFLQYVERLIAWQELREFDCSDIFISRNTTKLLFEQNKYPIWDEIKTLIQQFGIDFIQPRDIVSLVDAFLQKFLKIEDFLKIDDCLFGDVTTDPDVREFRDDPFSHALGELLAYMALKSFIDNEGQEYQILVTDIPSVENLRIQTEVSVVVHSSTRHIPEGKKIDNVFRCCCSSRQLILLIDFVYLWRKSRIASQRVQVLSLRSIALSQQNGKRVHLEDLAQFSFGQDFSPSARSMGFHTNDVLTERLLKSMAEVVLDLNMQSTHALRESKGGNSQQINSNGYRAWRKDITYEYHLHYWKKGQRIVFSNIRPHNDFGISPLLGSLPNG